MWEELSAEGSILLWSVRVVIPKKLCARVLEELHRGPAGVVCMKQLAHSHVWWPGIDAHTVRACEACQQYRKAPPAAPLHGCHGTTFMWISWVSVVTDFHSKWPEVLIMSNTTAASTIEALGDIFAHNGLPWHLVSDNRLQFVSDEFKQFMRSNGFNTC